MITLTELEYLCDLIRTVKDEDISEGVLDELDNAEDMIYGWINLVKRDLAETDLRKYSNE